MSRKGIPTTYNGIRFRSRLEAKWAVVFDAFGWAYEYEPFDLEGWIPDFVLKFNRDPILVEVKPETSEEELLTHAPKIDATSWNKEVLLIGACPLWSEPWHSSAIGLLRETHCDSPNSKWWELAPLHNCRACQQISFLHQSGDYSCRQTGCSYKDHGTMFEHDNELMQKVFNEAANVVQWKGKGKTRGLDLRDLVVCRQVENDVSHEQRIEQSRRRWAQATIS